MKPRTLIYWIGALFTVALVVYLSFRRNEGTLTPPSPPQPPVRDIDIASPYTAPQDPSGVPLASMGSIKGTVAWPDGTGPAVGAEILVDYVNRAHAYDPYPETHTQWKAQTDEAGAFQVADLPVLASDDASPAFVLIIASKDGHSSVRSVKLTDKRPQSILTLTLWPVGEVGGQVVDPAGLPISGAVVKPFGMAIYEGRLGRHHINESWTHTDADGRFRIGHLNSGNWNLSVVADGYAPHITAPAETGTEGLRISLALGQRITGTVVSGVGKRTVADLDLLVTAQNPPSTQRITRTDSQGNFRISGLSEGPYTVATVGTGKQILNQAPQFVVQEQEIAPKITLTIGEMASIAGVVVENATETPLPEISMVAVNSDHYEAARHYAVTDTEGRFLFSGLPDGDYIVGPKFVSDYLSAHQSEVKTVSVSPGNSPQNLRFRLPAYVGISGRVIDQHGKPVEDVRVGCHTTTGGGISLHDFTNRDGRFHITGVPGGSRIELSISWHDYVPDALEPIDLGYVDKEVGDILVRKGGSLRGVVVAPDGRQQGNVRVKLTATTGEEWWTEGPRMDGGFWFYQLPADTYTLEMVRADDYSITLPHSTPVTVVPGQTLNDLRLLYDGPPGTVIAGRVTDQQGLPVPYANVNAYAEESESHRYSQADSEGAYLISVDKNSTYMVSVQHPDYFTGKLSHARASEEAVNLVLRDQGTVTGQLLDDTTGVPLPNFEIAHTTLLGRYLSEYQSCMDDEGRFRIHTVADDTTTLAIRAQGYAPLLYTVTEAEPESSMDIGPIRMKRGASIEGRVVTLDGDPTIGAELAVDYHDLPHNAPLRVIPQGKTVATTDEKGFFRIFSLPEDIKGLTVAHHDYESQTTPLILVAGQVTPVRVVLNLIQDLNPANGTHRD